MNNRVSNQNPSMVIGRNPVLEILKGERSVEKILVQDGAKGSAGKIISLAKGKGIRIEYVSKDRLDAMSEGENHQGVLCYTSSHDYVDIKEIVDKAGESSLIILLDEVEDPHNLGAIMRTAECTGADGVIIPKRRSTGLTETVAKVSAGAIEYIPCARVTNLAVTIDYLKDNGYWIYAADMAGEELWDTDLKGRIALVLGSEGKGISRLVKGKCDHIISIPLKGNIESLNVSNAAAVIMYEVLRQNRGA